ncbi:Chaperone protein ClpC1 [Durusdinium trenchii]|uniref:Chloroplastic (ATP-dependent Clp protease ATP-binding subunit ClpC homolog 1) (Casein lytic proteinase C1) (Protein DE-REGULATED CAO ACCUMULATION 1) (Protein IRON-RESCUED MUTANT 1) n=1 Tax=Durusdinium trenchii TaxID=1381693 RepID=A0ABP0KAJ6_9DINO
MCVPLVALHQELQEKDEKSLVGVTSRGGGSGKTVTLEEFGNDLTKEGKMDPLVGRAAELERTIQILARRQKNNPVLIGEPGVGKTAIAEGLAQKIVSGDVPELLQGKRIVQLDLAMLLAGTRYRGEFEERLKNVIKEVLDSKKQIILMIDEIHTIVGAGGTGDGGGAIDAGNIMKPALSRGELQVIGATTIEEYRKYIEKDKALERRFQPVNVPEPTNEETLTILHGLAKKYEEHHKLKYTDEALAACVKFASQYIQDRFLPDKAIDVLDETGARVRLRESSILPEEAKEAQQKLKEVMGSKEEAVRNQNYELAGELKAEEAGLRAKIKSIISESKASLADDEDDEDDVEDKPRKEILVTEADVAAVVSKWTGVPVEKVLHSRVIGQNEAVTAVAKAVRRARAGLKNPNRPIASFIFCGPTGVGKTELCKALAAAYFGKEEAMIRLDMSEFMERHTVSKLIGSPPGYVGYDEESQLTDGIRRKPYSLVLFDEVEKAHPDVFNLMLQILEDGRLTDSKGRVVSFKNALIIMTSNVGAKAIEKGIQGGGGIGFSGLEDGDDAETSSYKRLKTLVFDELKNFFKPEFLNRLDEVIVFRSLTKPEVSQIAELEFKKTFGRTKERGIHLRMTDKFKQKVVDEGFNPTYGARPLRRAIMRLVEDELAESFLKEPTREGEHILMDVNADGNVMILRDQPAPEGEADGNGEEVKVVETTAA